MWVLVITVVALLGGLFGPAQSSKQRLVQAFLAVQDLTYEELTTRYTLEARSVWSAS